MFMSSVLFLMASPLLSNSALASGDHPLASDGLAQASSSDVPPPPPVVVEKYSYSGPTGQGEYTAAEIVELVSAQPDAQHYLWKNGWTDWKPWNEVAEIAEALAAPPPPPQSQTGTAYSHVGPEGTVNQLTGAEIAELLRTNPDQQHMVWKQGYTEWVPALQVPEIAELVKLAEERAAEEAAPPPPPPVPVAPAPPQAVETAAPTTDLVVEQSEEPSSTGCHRKAGVRLGGEAWFNFSSEHLELMSDENASPTVEFTIPRARFRADAQLSSNISARLNVDFPQDFSTTTYGVDGNYLEQATIIDDSPDTWGLFLKDAYVDIASSNAMHRVRTGLQKPVFGTRDFFNDFDAYFLGGNEAFKTLAWRAGMVDDRDLGVAYQLQALDMFQVDVQLLNGSGSFMRDENNAKDFIGRAMAEPLDFLRFQASVLAGANGSEGDSIVYQGSLSGEVFLAGARLIAELLMAQEGTTADDIVNSSGFMVAAAYDIDLSSSIQLLDHLSLLGRYMAFDPVAGNDYPDAWAIMNVATQLYWNTRHHKTFLTGLTYEGMIPENIEEPVTHSLVVQSVWKF